MRTKKEVYANATATIPQERECYYYDGTDLIAKTHYTAHTQGDGFYRLVF